ncbi:exocyst complex component EXO70E2-like [Magnolia sinica]|uniref:exocyst complex component EXO70E2-like n=1 Tax=Magnolia sinica TaxID=86752 RepID=UPI002658DDDE|nr:exocyst complex component EXO70E2-like [Magnolia sinica]XP_058080509.1 exocyst complex component EXO70E2-like [Magnolia sinica]
MDDYKSVGVIQGDEQVIAIAQNILKALEASNNFTNDMKRVLLDFNVCLSRKSEILEKQGSVSEIEERFNSVLEKVMNWDSDRSIIWNPDLGGTSKHLQAIDEIRSLIESLESLSLSEDQEKDELLQIARSILQMAMSWIEEEFIKILVENRQPLEPERISLCLSEDRLSFAISTSSVDDDSDEDTQARLKRHNSKSSEDFIVDLIHPDVIADLKCIAEVMFMSNYDRECCQAYISIRKDALEDSLFMLEIERLNMGEVLQMEWSFLNSKIKKWIRGMKIFVHIYLANEKRLSNEIFGVFGLARQSCFIEASKGLILQLLSYGKSIAIRPHSPENLFLILDMYDGLTDLLPDIDVLFSEEAGSSVRTEFRVVLMRLGDHVRGTCVEFKNAVRMNVSKTPLAGGGIHPLTRYVINYVKTLTDYNDTLKFLLEKNGEDHISSLSGLNTALHEDDWRSTARYIQSVISILESNLECKSNLYNDGSLQHFFLMNNVFYIVQKADSDLGAFLEDDWIRNQRRKIQQLQLNYERASWSLILSFLKIGGVPFTKSGSVSSAILKEKFQRFNLALEEIYKTQTAWLVPNLQFRDDLRISISLKVLQAYREFMGWSSCFLGGERRSHRYIKYSPEDLQEFILDLFEGSPRSLHKSHRRIL